MEKRIPLTFRIYRGETLVREETLTQDIIKIGKLPSSHLQIEDDKVSRMHAVIEVTGPGEIHVIDLGSSSGTLVNGQKVNKCALQDGDELRLGETRIVVGVGEPIAVQPPQPQAAVAPPMPAYVPLPGMGVPPPVAMGMAAAAPAPAYTPVSDPTLDKQDGSRAIEVTSLLGDSVIKVKHLDNPAAGKVGVLTYALTGVGWAMFLVGFVSAIIGQPGLAAVMMVVGIATGVYGVMRLRDERKSPHFTLGDDPKADLHLATPAIPAPLFPLIKSSGVDYSLCYTDQMSGDVTVGADRIELKDLTASGRAQPGEYPGSRLFTIPQDARIKVDVGETTFLVNSVA